MNKHERFARKEWEWLFKEGFRPKEYAFEVTHLEHAAPKHIDVYIEKLAEARARHEVAEPEEE